LQTPERCFCRSSVASLFINPLRNQRVGVQGVEELNKALLHVQAAVNELFLGGTQRSFKLAHQLITCIHAAAAG
jgi:hypothetical protein